MFGIWDLLFAFFVLKFILTVSIRMGENYEPKISKNKRTTAILFIPDSCKKL